MHVQCMLKMSRVYTLTEISTKIFVKNRGVKFPNKLLALHVPKFSLRCSKLESTTQIVKTFLALHILLENASGRVEFYTPEKNEGKLGTLFKIMVWQINDLVPTYFF